VLFEFLILEGAQAGLSWNTILRKRENYRKALDGFRPEKIARYGKRDVQRLLGNDGIVRNRLKIAATIENAQRFLEVRKEFGSFDGYLWSFVGGSPIQNRWRTLKAPMNRVLMFITNAKASLGQSKLHRPDNSGKFKRFLGRNSVRTLTQRIFQPYA
jgi:DNA-3-methyladenine glycosylase I